MKAMPQNTKMRKPSNTTVALKTRLTRADMKRIDIYSDKNRITNCNELYSVLKPLTSSDSPSAKSKGARFVSAKDERKRMIMGKKRNVDKGLVFGVCKVKLKKTILCKITIERLTS